MTGYKDPRMSKYFLQPISTGVRRFIGCRAGAPIGSNVLRNDFTPLLMCLKQHQGYGSPPLKWLFAGRGSLARMEYGRRYGQRNIDEEGIRRSFSQWDADGVATYLMDNTSTEANYIDAIGGYGGDAVKVSTITIKWDDNATMAEKMERLITQKWIALYPNGQEAWNEIRRTGYPHIFAITQIQTVIRS